MEMAYAEDLEHLFILACLVRTFVISKVKTDKVKTEMQ